MSKRAGSEMDLVPVAKRPRKEEGQAAAITKAPVTIVYFKISVGMPVRLLSNLSSARTLVFGLRHVTPAMEELCPLIRAWIGIHGEERAVPSSEHLWQALSKSGTYETFNTILSLGWDLKNFGTPGMSNTERAKRMAYWKRMEGLGVAAKMAVAKLRATPEGIEIVRAPRVGIKVVRFEGEFSPVASFDLLKRVWLDILAWKFAQHPEARAALLATGRSLLVEQERVNPEKKYWGGLIDKETGRLLARTSWAT